MAEKFVVRVVDPTVKNLFQNNFLNRIPVPCTFVHTILYLVLICTLKVEQNLVESTQNVSARRRKRQPKDLETYRLELARSLHTEPTHSTAKETAKTA